MLGLISGRQRGENLTIETLDVDTCPAPKLEGVDVPAPAAPVASSAPPALPPKM